MKLAKILGKIGTIQKTGRNAYAKYDYYTEGDFFNTIRPLLAEASVFMFFSVVSSSREEEITLVIVECTFVDGDTGVNFTVRGQGQSTDKQGKGVYSATTGAMKYILQKNFLLAEQDDEPHHQQQPARHR